MTHQVYESVREAIYYTVAKARMPMKALAAELDWSPSQLSMATTLGEDNARPFPADDAHLVRLMRVTGDHSVLHTLASLLGYELRPRAEAVPALLQEVQQEIRRLAPKMQLLLDLGAGTAPPAAPARRAR